MKAEKVDDSTLKIAEWQLNRASIEYVLSALKVEVVSIEGEEDTVNKIGITFSEETEPELLAIAKRYGATTRKEHCPSWGLLFQFRHPDQKVIDKLSEFFRKKVDELYEHLTEEDYA